MTKTQYALMIDWVCGTGFAIIVVPLLVYFFTGWRVRRDKLLSYMNAEALKIYYEQFPWKRSQEPNLEKRFKDQFSFLYGRRRYIVPVVLLLLTAGGAALTIARSLQAWFGVAPSALAIPRIALSALLGAFVWIAADQLARIRQRDLSPFDIYTWSLRLLIAVPFGSAFAAILKEDAGVPVAFLLGTFPTRTLFRYARRIVTQKLGMGGQQTDGSLELEKLQSIGRSNAERYHDEGINSIAALAWADPIDLTIRTNFDFNYVLDCMSQALLWVYFEEKTKLLYPLSLRGAQEALSLTNGLGGVTIPLDPSADLTGPQYGTLNDVQKDALATLQEASKLLNISKAALCTTLFQVSKDPYTIFINNVWH